jgi:Protein of unknown function (DUF4043)
MKLIKYFRIFLLAVLLAAAFCDSQTSASGLVMANVIGGLWTPNMQLFRRAVGKKVEKLVWRYSKWNQFIEMVDVKEYKEAGTYAGARGIQFEGNLIHMVKDFEKFGGIYMDIPVEVPLTGPGTYGAQELKGNEEDQLILIKKTAVNQIRHAVKLRDNLMSEQVLTDEGVRIALMKKGGVKLKDWFTRKLGFMPWQALLEGYSENIWHPIYGVKLTRKSHPNTFVRGSGRVAFGNIFNAGYETAVAAALATLSDTAAKRMSSDLIKNAVYLANQLMLQPITIKGKDLIVMFMSSASARDLRSDTDFLNALQLAGERSFNNPLFTGQLEGIPYQGAYIIIDDTIAKARINGMTDYDATRGTVNYHVAGYMKTPRDSSPLCPLIVCGAGAITGGYASPLVMKHRTDDYEQFLADGAQMICGMERADITDDDNYLGGGAGAFFQNSSSFVYWHWALDSLTNI